MLWIAGVGVLATLSFIGYRLRRRPLTPEECSHEDPVEVTVIESRPTTKYAQWAEDCRTRVGIVGPIVNDIMSVGTAQVSRLHFELDTQEAINVWLDGPEWLGPFPRVTKASWAAKEHLVVAQDEPSCFEQTLLLARGGRDPSIFHNTTSSQDTDDDATTTASRPGAQCPP